MHLELVGLNHRTAPVEVRERLAFQSASLADALARLTAQPPVREAVILSTCNRVEIYAAGSPERLSADPIVDFLVHFHRLDRDTLRPHLYFHADRAVVRHLFGVAASIDSLVVGEPEILGQVKAAYLAAAEHQATGKLLNALFQAAIKAGKDVRSRTAIGSRRVSVSSVAVELAHKIFGRLDDRTVLVLGGGDMAEQALRRLLESGAATALVANRTLARAQALARRHGAQAIPVDRVRSRLPDADVVLCSTAAPHYVLTRDHLRDALRGRRNAPLFVIDVAVPRNVDPAAAELDNVFLYDIDDLESVVSRNRAEREAAVTEAYALIERHAAAFVAQLGIFKVEPLIARLQSRAAQLRDAELSRLLGKLDHLSDDDKAAVARALERLTSKLLHRPTVALREAAATHGHQPLADALARLFALEDD